LDPLCRKSSIFGTTRRHNVPFEFLSAQATLFFNFPAGQDNQFSHAAGIFLAFSRL
jgi:hypothetical protein